MYFAFSHHLQHVHTPTNCHAACGNAVAKSAQHADYAHAHPVGHRFARHTKNSSMRTHASYVHQRTVQSV